MVSEFRKQKLLHVYSFYDTDKSGTVEKKDFDLAAEFLCKARRWGSDNPKQKEVHDTLSKVWEGLRSQADADNDGQVTQDEWIAMWDNFAKNPSAPADWQSLYCKFAFQLEDGNDDGVIDCEDFASVNSSFGINKEECVAAFKKIAQGKESISWEEFQVLWYEFFSSEDPSAPGNFVFCKEF